MCGGGEIDAGQPEPRLEVNVLNRQASAWWATKLVPQRPRLSRGFYPCIFIRLFSPHIYFISIEDQSVPSLTDVANKLRDRIWFTRIARIYAEKRLLRNELHSQLLLMAYSVYNIAVAVTLLKYKPISDDAGAILGIVLSVALFGLSFQLTARNFSVRAQRFKENYTLLQELLGRLELAELQTNQAILEETIKQVQDEYGRAIVGCENHTTLDDRCARYQYGSSLTTREPTCREKISVFGYSIGRYIVLGLLYMLPPVIFGCTLIYIR